jgi:hypothetical protein
MITPADQADYLRAVVDLTDWAGTALRWQYPPRSIG